MKEEKYLAPEVEILNVQVEKGVFASNEDAGGDGDIW